MIHLLFTGGTISMRRDEAAGGNVPVLDGEALVRLVPGLPAVSPFRIEDWGRFPACHLGPEDLWRLRERVRAIQTGPDRPTGIVITHGTDTIEETAYLLARTLDPQVPVTITGAMRTSSDAEWDGPRNLTDAARVAADPGSAGRGAMVVFCGKIVAGLEAAKTHATDPDAFEAPHAGPIGRVEGERVAWSGSRGAPADVLRPPALTARVALVPMVIGDRGELLDLVRPTHEGVVIVAFGSGNLPPGALPAIRRWLGEGKPVILATRCLYDQVTPVYAFPGGGATLVREGLIPAGPRTPAQARMELVIAMSAGRPYGKD
jgi:L-asparaginase